MLATRRAPSSRAAVLRQGAARTSMLGLGLLVAGGAAASPALAEEGLPEDVDLDAATSRPVEVTATTGPLVEETEWTATSPVGAVVPAADFGNQKTLTIQLSAPEDAPGDLSLAGATFDLVRGDGSTAATCTTTHAGKCSFWSSVRFSMEPATASNVEVAAGGTYTLRQSGRSAGLALLPGDLGRVYICGFDCNSGRWTYYTPDSLFRTALYGTAVDADSGNELGDATFALTGPGYPRKDGTAAPAEQSWGSATSDADGQVSWSGWFLPGNYAVAAVEDAAGGMTGEPASFVLAAWEPFQEYQPTVDMTVRYLREDAGPVDPEVVDPEPEDETAPDSGGAGGDTGSQPTGSVGAAPVGGAPVGGSTASAGAGAPANGARTVPSPAAAAASSTAAPSEAVTVPRSAPASSAPRTTANPSVVAAAEPVPGLETASSALPDLRVVGLGVLFLSAVGGGLLVLWMRRRARGF